VHESVSGPACGGPHPDGVLTRAPDRHHALDRCVGRLRDQPPARWPETTGAHNDASVGTLFRRLSVAADFLGGHLAALRFFVLLPHLTTQARLDGLGTSEEARATAWQPVQQELDPRPLPSRTSKLLTLMVVTAGGVSNLRPRYPRLNPETLRLNPETLAGPASECRSDGPATMRPLASPRRRRRRLYLPNWELSGWRPCLRTTGGPRQSDRSAAKSLATHGGGTW
jgi:hypothetical protein